MRQNDGGLAGALEAFEHVQQEGIVAVLFGRGAVFKTAIHIVGRVQATGPCFGGEGRVGHNEIKGLQAPLFIEKVRPRQGVVLPDFGGGAVVQHHVHAGERTGGVVHFLAVDGQVKPGAGLGFVVRLEQQRARAAGGVIDALRGAVGLAQTNDLRHDARHLGRGVELAFALAAFGGEVAHEVFIRIAQQVVALGSVAAEVEPFKNGHQLA